MLSISAAYWHHLNLHILLISMRARDNTSSSPPSGHAAWNIRSCRPVKSRGNDSTRGCTTNSIKHLIATDQHESNINPPTSCLLTTHTSLLITFKQSGSPAVYRTNSRSMSAYWTRFPFPLSLIYYGGNDLLLVKSIKMNEDASVLTARGGY